MRVSRALFLLASVLMAGLPKPHGLWGQDLGYGTEPFPARTRFEVSYSGFSQASQSGNDYVFLAPDTQETSTFGAIWDWRVGGFVFRAAFEQNDSSKDVGEILEDTVLSNQIFRVSYVGSKWLVPYLGISRNFFEIDYLDSSLATPLNVLTRDELEAGFAGFSLFLPLSEGVVPFFGYAFSSENFSIFSQVTGLQVPDETYRFVAHFFEAGVILGREEGLHASLGLKQKNVSAVPGQTYNLGGIRAESQEFVVGFGSPSESGINLGYATSVQERSIDQYYFLSRQERKITLEIKINEVWLLKLAQNEVSVAMDFLLPATVVNSRNDYRENSLTIVWQF